jgi:DNA-binding NarL/FixJ family response regulator
MPYLQHIPYDCVTVRVHLSPREHRLAALTAQGKTNKQIAGEMGIGYGTVRQYLCVLSQKLGVKGRTAVALWYVEHRRKEKTV